MAILVDKTSRILIQGITGSIGRSFAQRMVEFGTPLVGGVTPGRRGLRIADVPVFDSIHEAVTATGAFLSLIVVPPPAVLDAVMEAADSGIALAVVYTEDVPVHDAVQACLYARSRGMLLCGPNSAGIVSPGQANLSDLNDANLTPGTVGLVSKSGTLTYEVILELGRFGLGISTVVCLGGDPVVGLDYAAVLEGFSRDPDTDAVVLIGEIGGQMEVQAVEAIRRTNKPIVAYVAGRFAPPQKRMGHAGAIISDATETAEAKMASLVGAGARAAPLLTDIAPLVNAALSAMNSLSPRDLG